MNQHSIRKPKCSSLEALQTQHRKTIISLAGQFLTGKEIGADTLKRYLASFVMVDDIAEILLGIQNSVNSGIISEGKSISGLNSGKKKICKSILEAPIILGEGSSFEVLTRLTSLIMASSEAEALLKKLK
jgi:hypothetical protein